MQGGNDEMRRAYQERADELAQREHRALARLAEMREAIERLRREREAKLVEFTDLTRKRDDTSQPPTGPATPSDDRPRTADADDAVASVDVAVGEARREPDDPDLARVPDTPASTGEDPSPDAAGPAEVAAPPPTLSPVPAGIARRTWTPWRVLVTAVGSGLALGASIAWLWVWLERPTRGGAPSARPADRPAVVMPTAPPDAGQDAAARSTPPGQLRVELALARPAWIRAVADGRTILSRTVGAGEQLALTATGSIEVRFGDAGAVRVRVNGEDRGAAGRDGQVLTRAFTVAESIDP